MTVQDFTGGISLLRAASLSALALALGLAALPDQVAAQDRGGGQGAQQSQGGGQDNWRGGGNGGGGLHVRHAPSTDGSGRGSWRDSGNNAGGGLHVRRAPSNNGSASMPSRPTMTEQRQYRANPEASAAMQRGMERSAQQRREWSGRNGDGSAQQQAQVPQENGHWSGRNRSYSDETRNRSYSDNSRHRDYRDYRDGRRDGNQVDVRRDGRSTWRDGDRNDSWRNDGWRDDGRRADRRAYSGNHRRWDREWRHNDRYDWREYRNHNRHIYRAGRYYAPYSGYHYRRLSIGFGLDTMFFSSRYWIDDPSYYRLPPAYGPYRWVRYYDDALLVDIYSGEVVDVIYDFFW